MHALNCLSMNVPLPPSAVTSAAPAQAEGQDEVLCSAAASLLERVDLLRHQASCRLDKGRRAELGQFLTPAPVASLMASMFQAELPTVRILDPGAGIGVLSAALVAELCQRAVLPAEIAVTAYEVDQTLGPYLGDTLSACRALCDRVGVRFEAEVLQRDFVEDAVYQVPGSLFASGQRSFDCVIVNPPYRKIHGQSRERLLLRQVGIETGNLYTAFVALSLRLLDPQGELVAITPRSFCNGPYFTPFRIELLREMSLRQLHVFESRRTAFRDDDVLQENIILHAVKDRFQRGPVAITSSEGPDDDTLSIREIAYDRLVRPDDSHQFIHLVPDELSHAIADRMLSLPATASDLNLTVSTGRVVEFRAKDHLRDEPDGQTVPLIYPTHLQDGVVIWPRDTRKPNAIVSSNLTADLLVPSGVYVLVKRFSAKEERRRVTAAVWEPEQAPESKIGIENHLNYFHHDGMALSRALAQGLMVYLNSSLVDHYFRQFSGHTQVNATDLRNLRYPDRTTLERLGRCIGSRLPPQEELDRIVNEELSHLLSTYGEDPIVAKHKVSQAIAILKDVGLPPKQQNERSALTLLALLDLEPTATWSDAKDPLIGITPMMEFMSEHYGKTYAPNSRETVRRQTVHQFLQAGVILINPDKPDRATNSGDTVYQVEPTFLQLVRQFGSQTWEPNLQIYLASVQTLQERYANARVMERIPVYLTDGTSLTLSPGGQNVLVKLIIEEFCPRFTPGAQVLYVGDTGDKDAYFDRDALEGLGVVVEEHGKLPDVIVHHQDKGWLVLIEAVTSHGPIEPKRHTELRELFHSSSAPIVYVTAFLSRQAMARYVDDIAWETEVWVADHPTHLIHFNGERFLGPYPTS